jgi:hypothetical protein
MQTLEHTVMKINLFNLVGLVILLVGVFLAARDYFL